jgi:deoxyribodipyrimidine photo-lyase
VSAINPVPFEPTRAAGLQRLEAFLPAAGRRYAAERNYDRGVANRANVSMLSPYVSHRLVAEDEIVRAAIRRHGMSGAAKFVEEVCWRTYWKGWLELRPAVWGAYLDELDQERARLATDRYLSQRYRDAVIGTTGIAAFDAWARELIETGYLHNHARMWFASIWIFTLRLPWTLGADFFYRHLIDGDAASNTLSWRWVAGLHTRGKAYAARADNIAKYTDGRFDVAGQLVEDVVALNGSPVPPPGRLRPAISIAADTPVVLVLAETDLTAEQWPICGSNVRGVAALATERSYPGLADRVLTFRGDAIADGLKRASRHFGVPAVEARGDAATIADFARSAGAELLITAHVPVGPARTGFEAFVEGLSGSGLAVLEVRRDWDQAFWPHAKRGFFDLKARIPEILEQLGLL